MKYTPLTGRRGRTGYSWATGSSGRYYQMRFFMIKELDQIWDTGLQNDDRPEFGEEREKIGKGATRNDIGGEKFELLLAH